MDFITALLPERGEMHKKGELRSPACLGIDVTDQEIERSGLPSPMISWVFSKRLKWGCIHDAEYLFHENCDYRDLGSYLCIVGRMHRIKSRS